jgi:hypothetical protein
LENNMFKKFKARLVAGGHKQVAYDSYDPNYTSSPVLQAASLNSILTLAAILDLELDTADVKNAFLTASLDQKIWIKLPPYVNVMDGKLTMDNNVVCLKKALYGLIQSSLCFFNKMRTFMLDIGFTQSKEDPCLFTFTGEEGTAIVGLYVDDLLCASSGDFFKNFLLPKMQEHFPAGITYETAAQFLGTVITRDRAKREIYLSQEARIAKLADQFKITETFKTPLDMPKAELQKLLSIDSLALTPERKEEAVRIVNNDENLTKLKNYNDFKTYYRSYTGNLIYTVCFGRPDIQQTVYRLARYQENPSELHIYAIRKVIGYLLGTKDKKLTFGRQRMIPTEEQPTSKGKTELTAKPSDVLTTFSDSSFADCPATRRSTGGYIHFLFGNYLASRSFKINCVCRSVTEAEFYTMSAAAADAIYYRNLYNNTLRPVLVHLLDKEDNDTSEFKDEIKQVVLLHRGLPDGNEQLLSPAIHPAQWLNSSDTVIYGDNKSAIGQIKNGMKKNCKHIQIHLSYIWEQMYIFRNIRIGKVCTNNNPADLQTKTLNGDLFRRHAATIMGENKSFTISNITFIYQ